MVITVEPGCYFNPFLLEPAFESPSQGPFLNRRRLEGSMASLYTLASMFASLTFNVHVCILAPELPVIHLVYHGTIY